MILKILKPPDKDKVKTAIDDLNPDKQYVIEIKIKREQRSIDQNRLYWLWLNCLMDETGEHRDNLHEYFKSKFLGAKECRCFDTVFFIPQSTTAQDTKQFTDYLERVRQFAATELNITLPDPKDQYWEEFYNTYKDYI